MTRLEDVLAIRGAELVTEPTALRMVRVEWIDSTFVVEGWSTIDDAKQHTARVFGVAAATVGLLLDEAPDYLLVCQSHQPAGEGGTEQVAECLAIPRATVTAVITLAGASS